MTGFDSKRQMAADKLQEPEREALKLALDALENHEGNYKLGNAGCDRQEAAITAIKEALAQPPLPVQEPVAQGSKEHLKIMMEHSAWDDRLELSDALANIDEFYATAPPLPVQEPVAQWLEDAFREGWEAYRESEFASKITEDWAFGNSFANCRMIDLQQNTPPQCPWVGLTVQERNDCLVNADPNECLADTEAHQLMVEVEAKLRERNS